MDKHVRTGQVLENVGRCEDDDHSMRKLLYFAEEKKTGTDILYYSAEGNVAMSIFSFAHIHRRPMVNRSLPLEYHRRCRIESPWPEFAHPHRITVISSNALLVNRQKKEEGK